MKKEIVIIGGGFGGINLALSLANARGMNVTLVDRNNYNYFPPLLYQVATGFLDVSNICFPFRKLFHTKKNLRFRLGKLESISPEEKKVILSTGELSYDYLVLATGTESNYFGLKNIRESALSLKTVDDAIEMRNFLLSKAEEATVATIPDEKKKLSTIVIAGGGPTGVEVAGMLAEMRRNLLEKDYPELSRDKVKIYLVDAAPVLLSSMSEAAQQYAYTTLQRMGVEVKVNMQVLDYVDDSVIFANGERIPTKLLVWTSGVFSQMIEGIPKKCYGRGARLLVDEYNKVAGMQDIYAIGDACLQTTDRNFEKGHPQLAQVAIQQGKNLAKNFQSIMSKRSLKPFNYVDKGSMAIIGRKKAVLDIPRPRMHISGFFAWLAWLLVHLFSLINYRNRVKTMYNWAIAYFTKDQSLRMIIRPRIECEDRSHKILMKTHAEHTA